MPPTVPEGSLCPTFFLFHSNGPVSASIHLLFIFFKREKKVLISLTVLKYGLWDSSVSMTYGLAQEFKTSDPTSDPQAGITNSRTLGWGPATSFFIPGNFDAERAQKPQNYKVRGATCPSTNCACGATKSALPNPKILELWKVLSREAKKTLILILS